MKNSPLPIIGILIVIAAIATVERNDSVVDPFDRENGSEYTNDYYYPEDDERQEEPSIDAPTTQKQESPYRAYVSLTDFTSSKYEGAPGEERVSISLSRRAPEPINITGWQIWSVATGNRATIGQGIYTYHQNGSTVVPVVLTPGQEARVYSGSSPFEYSFVPNICMAYLADTRDVPRGFPSRCPDPADKAFPLPFFDRGNECRDYIETMASCEAPSRDDDFDAALTRECRAYIREITGYENCVRLWQNDEDFYEDEWWIYLEKPSRMYGDRDEQILLFDERGILVDSY
ncbi:MAG: hypothetical protein COV34_03415 [Candidatus Zambryskibacteria bacterium CG10_big_fil_rev_8_21_14_0_10_42_12]|uniref:LTD domain-containing protein n=1 Tax=Candidatus Zambryskibacteria bacterium CG10_big_fil_rev_8_21_14_0_10_42_12 TaxID=1975115 RepID=A0A2H0QTW8_9BACT|nr:MAG: hypothetical protein COV34_03415 [Candidatus Zambryskibacteria bacterium CG10_big_fil_rev_8_21_14_0_10_42_12]